MSTGESQETTYVDAAQLTVQQQCAAERDFIQLSADLAVKQGVLNRGPESYLCLPDNDRSARGRSQERGDRLQRERLAFDLGPRCVSCRSFIKTTLDVGATHYRRTGDDRSSSEVRIHA